jgi:hypothetical protein
VSENRIITDTSELITPPKDAFWDAPVSRRMYQQQLNQIGRHIADLWAAADTANIMINFIMEKKLMADYTPEQLRAEVDAYVEEKKAQLAAMRATAIGQVGANESSNG